jgi:acetyl esterase/lipase
MHVRDPRPIRLLVEPVLRYGLVLPSGCEAQQTTLDQSTVIRIRNQRAQAASRILIYVHGGGYVFGSPHTHKGYAARLMHAGACQYAYLPFYGLAPEHPYPAGIEDLLVFWRSICARYPDHELILAGESAGAGLCMALFQKLRHHHLKYPSKIFLHSPWLDLGLTGASYDDLGLNDGFLGRHPQRKAWVHRVFARHYLGSHDPSDPLVSPVHMDVAQLPPLLIQVAAQEIFLADSQRLAERCQAQQIDCQLSVWHNLWHAFGLFAPWLPEANLAIREAGKWIRRDREGE